MKRNLMTVLILALLIVNIVLTSVMMISVMGTNKKTSELVNNIATAMNLELTTPGKEGETQVSLKDTKIHNITGSMTIPLSADPNGDDKQNYIVFDVALAMNSKDEDYKTYGENIGDNESLIKEAITSVVSTHTKSECQSEFEDIKAEILKAVQDLFQSDFIYKIAISGVQIS